MDKMKSQTDKNGKIKNSRIKQNKILVVGGYGYKNVGDEAQLNVVIKRLEKLFPKYMIRVLSPNINYTHETHNHSNVGEASRIAFFHEGKSVLFKINGQKRGLIYNVANEILKILFLIKSIWIYFNSFLVKYNLPTLILGSQAASLLYDIKTSKLLYFEGGGYLTGKTLSRLWDGILLCKIAKLYNTKVVMSGQTIGVFGTRFNKWYSKIGFKDVKLITLRDPKSSVDALKEIGVEGKHIYPVCDDALFCEREESNDIMKKVYVDSGCIENFEQKEYIAFNIHYWGLTTNEQKRELLEKINEKIKHILENSNYDIIFIPMVPPDEDTMKDYMEKYPNNRIKMIRYDYDFKIIRSVIAQAKICITMKHHPIIFSVGELTPVLSLNLSEYYEHKNGGALEILGISRYKLSLDRQDCFNEFKNLYSDINENYEEIVNSMKSTLDVLKNKTKNFEEQLANVIK